MDTYLRKLELESNSNSRSAGPSGAAAKKSAGHVSRASQEVPQGPAAPVLQGKSVGVEHMLQQLEKEDSELEALKSMSRSAKSKASAMKNWV